MKGKFHFFALATAFILGAFMSCGASDGGKKAQMYQAKADAYLVKSDSIRNFFAITEAGVFTYASPEDKLAGNAEFSLLWEEVPAFRRMIYASGAEQSLAYYLSKNDAPKWDSLFGNSFPEEAQALPSGRTAEKPLLGMRIALDPGHLGGTMEFARKTERKFVRMKADPRHGLPTDIDFNEGNLALATAMVLKEQLEAAGAEVLVSRTGEGKGSMGMDLDEWLNLERIKYEKWSPVRLERGVDLEDYLMKCAGANYAEEYDLSPEDSLWWCTKATRRHIYRIPFLKQDFKDRARKINAFRPHLTLIIHYNIHETNEADPQGYLRPTDKNYCMAFVPGSFMEGELGKPEDRLAFLCKLLTDDIETSEKACDFILKEHVGQLGVPIMEWDESINYLNKASLQTTAEGVFARNLSLTRLINGPMCFGESLLQDNIEECQRFNVGDFTAEGMTTPVSNRVKEVAQAYFDGVVKWAGAE